MTVRRLADIRAGDPAGRKAASLSELAAAGLPVPPGFVVFPDAFVDGELAGADATAVAELARALGGDRFAVRSSALAEDGDDASFAGQYRTILAVPMSELPSAIEQVARPARPLPSYAPPSPVAVLVQPMVDAAAAGVAFTADPVTGERSIVVLHAVRGLGDALVAGRVDGEEWRGPADAIERTAGGSRVLAVGDAQRIASFARDVARRRGRPQEIEWALTGSDVTLLQARPMTALPEEVRWDAPRGAYSRAFRLGEWIGDPVTPLFESWLLTTMERTMHDDYARLIGQPAPRPLHVLVNGWYFYSLAFLPASPAAVLRMLPGILARLPRHGRRLAPVFPPLARLGVDVYAREWREQLLPAYRRACASASAAVNTAPIDRLMGVIDDLAAIAGHYFTSVTFVAGYGWKTEIPLASFYRRQVMPKIGGHHDDLLRGVAARGAAPHAVQSLDWYFPTLGEIAHETGAGRARVPDTSADPLERARAALTPGQARRLETLVREARRGAALREEQVADLTLAWPVFRRALARIGDALVRTGVIARAEDVHFLTREELGLALSPRASDRSALVGERRATWEAQRRLVPPLVIGRLPALLETMLGTADRALRDPADGAQAAIRGVPASSGRATGRARVIRGVEEFDRLAPGDVLVCRVTTPAWAALFDRAAGVVTDVGSPAAHASVLAREYGIPAVVGTGDATARIGDGALVTVDGGAGLVTLVRIER